LIGSAEEKNNWGKLIKLCNRRIHPNFSDVIIEGFNWLPTHFANKNWAIVWRDVLYFQDQLTYQQYCKLLTLGIDWLAENQYSDNWRLVYELFLDLNYKSIRFVQLGSEWIYSNHHRKKTVDIAIKLLPLSLGTPSFIKIYSWLDQWLIDNLKNKNWPRVWITLTKYYMKPIHIESVSLWLADGEINSDQEISTMFQKIIDKGSDESQKLLLSLKGKGLQKELSLFFELVEKHKLT
jgi:hypothetical protein